MANNILTELMKNRNRSQINKYKKLSAATPIVQDQTLQTWIKDVSNTVQDITKSSVRRSDLVKAGIATVTNGELQSALTPNEEVNLTVPSAVLNLTANGAYGSITLVWEKRPSKYFGQNNIYRSDVDDFGTATHVGTTVGDIYTDYIGNNIKAYYWVRTISKFGVEGDLAPSVTAKTAIDVEYVLGQISGEITLSHLDQTLRAEIGQIDQIANDLLLESNKSIVALTAEADARIAAVKKEKEDREAALALIVNYANQSFAAVNSEVDKVEVHLADETVNRIAAVKLVSDGLTSEITNRVAGDTANLNVINNYKLSNDTALANMQEQVTLNTTSNSANATKISALDVRLTTNDTTTSAANSLAATAVSKAETALTENTAQASQINGLNTSIESINGSLLTKADASALTALDTKVTNQGGLVTSQGTAITKLTNDLTALNIKTDTKASSDVVSALESKVTSIDGQVTSQGTSINSFNNRLTLAEGSLSKKAESSALSSLDSKVTAINGNVTSQGTSITNLDARLSSAEGTLTSKANSSAVSALDSKVTQQGNTITSQGTDITKLKADLALTNTAVSTKASSDAVQSLDNRVVVVDGRVTSNANSITALSGKVTTIEGQVETKAEASALNSYYTKEQADKATAGKINEYKAALSIGGVNQLKNSEAERTSQAAGTKEYLPYELSPELKAFYNDNLNKDITVSFDLKVAVAGPVEVYCSNGTFHTFSASINVAAADVDTWVRYAVTTQPRLHPTNTASLNSALEFYGTYSTGRIPFLRKVQLEAGNVATDWSVSPRDTQAALSANATAINTTNTEVSRVNGVVVSQGTALTKLTGDLATTNGTLATKADGAALTALTNRVTSAEGVNTTQSSNITTLTNNLATTEGKVSNKAESSAVSALDSKITAIDGRVTTESNRITTLTGRISTVENGLASKADVSALNNIYTKAETDAKATILAAGEVSKYDANLVIGGANTYDNETTPVYGLTGTASITQRNSSTTPNGFLLTGDSTGKSSVRLSGVITEKGWWTISFYARGSQNTSVGFTIDITDGTLHTVLTTSDNSWTYVQYSYYVDYADGNYNFIDFNDIFWAYVYLKDIKVERGSKATAWTPSNQHVLGSLSVNATAINSTNTEVSRVNGVVTATANSLTTLQSTVGANTSAISIQGSVINGIKAEYTIKTDVNGLVSGIGLINDGTTSAIGINADMFYIGSPANNKKPFAVLGSSGFINGVSVPAGTYIDTAFIANGTINNLQVGNLSADKITSGSIAADRMKANIVQAVAGQFQSLSAITGTIGHLRTATTGARTEIRDNLIEVYDDTGRVRVRLGVF